MNFEELVPNSLRKTANHASEYIIANPYEASNTYPELKSELRSMIELRYEESSPAFQAKSRHIIKKLNKEVVD